MTRSENPDDRFGEIAVAKGFLSREQFADALKRLHVRREEGVETTLKSLLLEGGVLTGEQAEAIRSELVGEAEAGEDPGEEAHAAVPGTNAGEGPPARGETLLDFHGEGEDFAEETSHTITGTAPDDLATLPGEPPPTIPPPGHGPGGAGVPDQEDRDGHWIGPYRIVNEVGRGGMGVVYKAFDPSLKRIVALKVLIGGEHASEDAITRFKREAEAVARLGYHPGIVPVFDMGNEGNLHYFAMAYVSGKSLSGLVDAGEITARRAMILVEKVARALQFAHDHGVLHRDVKPDNILVDGEGVPSLTDFGLAKDVRDDSRLTVSGTAMGTPQYMPPEQADGQLDRIDPRADVYSLGATLYEALAHVPPFSGASQQNVIYKVLNEEPESPRKRNPAVPRDAETICLKAMEKDAERRYQGAEEMADDIKRFLDGEAILARPASLVYRVSKRVKKNLPFYVSGTVGTLLLVSLAVFFLFVKPALDHRREVEADTARLDQALAERMEPQREAEALLEEAKAFFGKGRHARCIESCETLISRFADLDGTRFTGLPTLRHEDLIWKERYRPLHAAYAIPVARAWALKARALRQSGDAEASLQAWFSAFILSKKSSDDAEMEVEGPALLAMGETFLAQRDLERACRTFRHFLVRYPDSPERGRGWFLLAETLWSQGRFRLVEEALDLAEKAGNLTGAQTEQAAWYREACRLFSSELIVPRLYGTVFPGDVDGDGRREMLQLDIQEGLSVHRLEGDRLVRLHHVPLADFFPGEDVPVHKVVNVFWTDFRGPGRGAVVAKSLNPEAILVLPLDAEGKPGRAIRHVLPINSLNLSAADMDGDGTREIVAGSPTIRPFPFYVFALKDGRLHQAADTHFSSFYMRLRPADLDGDGREEVLVTLQEYADWRAYAVRYRGAGRPLDVQILSPYRMAGTILDVSMKEGKAEALWILSRLDGAATRILKRTARPEHLLSLGLYRVPPFADQGASDFSDPYPGDKGSLGGGFLLPGEDLFVIRETPRGGPPALCIRPTEKEKRWAVHRFPEGTVLGAVFGGDFDGDADPEVWITHKDVVRILGAGTRRTPAPEALLGAEASRRNLDAFEDPLLSTAIEMAAMDLKPQALALFREAARTAEGPFQRRRAKLGEADSLVALGRVDEGVDVYRELIGSSSAGITEELFSFVRLLREREAWQEIHDLLLDTLEDVPLPVETERWARDILQRTEPLTRMNHRFPVLPAKKYDPSYLCQNPLKSPGDREGTGFEFFSDGARHSSFGRILRYDGGPFRLEARVVLHRLDWTAHLFVGLIRVRTRNEQTNLPTDLLLQLNPGRCTNEPSIMAHWGGDGVGRCGLTLQEYPRELPTEYAFTLEYAPTMDRITLRVADLTRDKTWKHAASTYGRIPPGKYIVGLEGGFERTDPSFQGRVTVKRLELVSASHGNAASRWEPEPGAFRLLRAGAALALGDLETAEALAGDVTGEEPDFNEILALPRIFRRPEDPAPTARAQLIRAFARLRGGDAPGFQQALGAALDADPAWILWDVSRSLGALTVAERETVGKVVRERMTADGGALAVRVASDLRANPSRKPNGMHGWNGKVLAALQAALKKAGASGDENHLLEPLYALIGRFYSVPLVQWFFAGTPLQTRARFDFLFSEANGASGRGDIPEAIETYETLLEAFPDDPRGYNGAAWLLVTTVDRRFLDPARARTLAGKAVSLAREERSPFRQEISMYLDTLARAHFLLEDLDKAVAVQEEALRELPPQASKEMREQLQSVLDRYRKEREDRNR